LTDTLHINYILCAWRTAKKSCRRTIPGQWPRTLFPSLFPATSHGGQVSSGYRKTLLALKVSCAPGQKGPNLQHFLCKQPKHPTSDINMEKRRGKDGRQEPRIVRDSHQIGRVWNGSDGVSSHRAKRQTSSPPHKLDWTCFQGGVFVSVCDQDKNMV
jgi:hypothetical protein